MKEVIDGWIPFRDPPIDLEASQIYHAGIEYPTRTSKVLRPFN